jgi:hypothetical protein
MRRRFVSSQKIRIDSNQGFNPAATIMVTPAKTGGCKSRDASF